MVTKQNRIKVTIADSKRIPTIGKGPIKNPIFITEEQFNLLTLLGFSIKVIKNDNVVEKRDVEEVIEEEVTEDIVEEEVIEEEVTEDIVEEEVIEVDINSLTKKELKEELEKRNISYAYNDNLSVLRKKLKDNI